MDIDFRAPWLANAAPCRVPPCLRQTRSGVQVWISGLVTAACSTIVCRCAGVSTFLRTKALQQVSSSAALPRNHRVPPARRRLPSCWDHSCPLQLLTHDLTKKLTLAKSRWVHRQFADQAECLWPPGLPFGLCSCNFTFQKLLKMRALVARRRLAERVLMSTISQCEYI